MSFALDNLGRALLYGFDMFWQVLWPLSLGFLLSAVVETVIPKRQVERVMGGDSVQSVVVASALGAASSSCSYASVAVARSLFRRGATFANAIIFEFASTNLVIELGLILFVLLGWQFLLGEISGGVLMIVVLTLIFRFTLRRSLVESARQQAEKGLRGKMEGHGAMDMSVTDGPFLRRLFSGRAVTAISHYYFMNLASLWTDLLIGFLVSGALAAWVPDSLWSKFFLTGNGAVSDVWGAFVGPLISMLAFVCSVGNVPLAAVLWRGGISFGGVIAFIFADLIIIPILNIYRKYYGWRMMLYLLVVSYAAMVVAGLVIGTTFNVLHLVPTNRDVSVFQDHPQWDYTTLLNIAFLVLSAVLGIRFLRTGGPDMLKMMEMAPEEMEHHHDDAHQEHAHH
jgi:uncharacterized membrane protein YraQ (UPF0718 family)